METAPERTDRPPVETVPLYEGRVVEVGPNGPKRVIATEALNGCVATVVACETADGERLVQLTHFPDFMRERQQRTVTDLMDSRMHAAPRKKVVLFLHRKRTEGAAELGRFFRILLGDPDIEYQFYDPDSSRDGSGTVEVIVPPTGQGPVSYRTWYNSGPVL